MNVRARRLFNELTTKLNLRCKTAFLDYDACNALTCGVPDCNAKFCAICLKDCGDSRNAHQHVQDAHQGGLYDKKAFYTSTKTRAKKEIDILLDKLSHEPFELMQLVRNHIERAKLTEDMTESSHNASAKTAAFLEKTKASLNLAVGSDRLALLSDPDEYVGRKTGKTPNS